MREVVEIWKFTALVILGMAPLVLVFLGVVGLAVWIAK